MQLKEVSSSHYDRFFIIFGLQMHSNSFWNLLVLDTAKLCAFFLQYFVLSMLFSFMIMTLVDMTKQSSCMLL